MTDSLAHRILANTVGKRAGSVSIVNDAYQLDLAMSGAYAELLCAVGAADRWVADALARRIEGRAGRTITAVPEARSIAVVLSNTIGTNIIKFITTRTGRIGREGAPCEPRVVQGDIVRYELRAALSVVNADHAAVGTQGPERDAVENRVAEVEVSAKGRLAGDEQDVLRPDAAGADQNVPLGDLHVVIAEQPEDHERVRRAVDHEVGVADFEVVAAAGQGGEDIDDVEARRGEKLRVRINDAGSAGAKRARAAQSEKGGLCGGEFS